MGAPRDAGIADAVPHNYEEDWRSPPFSATARPRIFDGGDPRHYGRRSITLTDRQ
jgi:hypothetical protein